MSSGTSGISIFYILVIFIRIIFPFLSLTRFFDILKPKLWFIKPEVVFKVTWQTGHANPSSLLFTDNRPTNEKMSNYANQKVILT